MKDSAVLVPAYNNQVDNMLENGMHIFNSIVWKYKHWR